MFVWKKSLKSLIRGAIEGLFFKSLLACAWHSLALFKPRDRLASLVVLILSRRVFTRA